MRSDVRALKRKTGRTTQRARGPSLREYNAKIQPRSSDALLPPADCAIPCTRMLGVFAYISDTGSTPTVIAGHAAVCLIFPASEFNICRSEGLGAALYLCKDRYAVQRPFGLKSGDSDFCCTRTSGERHSGESPAGSRSKSPLCRLLRILRH